MQSIDTLALMAVKDEAVLVRLTTKEKRLLQKAADLARRKISDYVRFAALLRAENDLGLSTTVTDDEPKKK